MFSETYRWLTHIKKHILTHFKDNGTNDRDRESAAHHLEGENWFTYFKYYIFVIFMLPVV